MTDPLATDPRTELQRECDKLDCDLYRIIRGVEALAQREPVAQEKLNRVSRELHSARSYLRYYMHPSDRARTS